MKISEGFEKKISGEFEKMCLALVWFIKNVSISISLSLTLQNSYLDLSSKNVHCTTWLSNNNVIGEIVWLIIIVNILAEYKFSEVPIISLILVTSTQKSWFLKQWMFFEKQIFRCLIRFKNSKIWRMLP